MTTHRGKIARLPWNLRDALNQRLEQDQPSAPILAWLNALPEVQAILASEFAASPINQQNLTNWRQGGFQDWLEQQEQRHLARELTRNAAELASDAGSVELANHWSTVLVAKLAAAARDAHAGLATPAERCAQLQEFLHTVARVRQQDYLAGRLALNRERQARDLAKEKQEDILQEEHQRRMEPIRQLLQRSHMTDLYARPDLTSQALAGIKAESLLREAKPTGNTQAEDQDEKQGVPSPVPSQQSINPPGTPGQP